MKDKLTFQEALKLHIVGHKVIGPASISSYSDHPYYGNGLIFDNGYMYLADGGTAAGGGDVNEEFIVDNKGVIIANETR